MKLSLPFFSTLGIIIICTNHSNAMHSCSRDDYTKTTVFSQLVTMANECFDQVRPLITDVALSHSSDNQVVQLYEHVLQSAFHSFDPKHATSLIRIISELAHRRKLSDPQKHMGYDILMSIRSFDQAALFLTEHGITSVEPLPRKIDNRQFHPGQPSVYTIMPNGLDVRLQNIDYHKDARLVVVGGFFCTFTQRAFQEIESDKILKPLFEKYAILLAPQFGFNLKGNSIWNKKHQTLPFHIVHRQQDFTEIDEWGMPNFYFFRRGTLLKKVTGWPKGGNREALIDGFNRIQQ